MQSFFQIDPPIEEVIMTYIYRHTHINYDHYSELYSADTNAELLKSIVPQLSTWDWLQNFASFFRLTC